MLKWNQRRHKREDGKKFSKNEGNKWKTVTNMVDINQTISLITLNVNGVHT